MSYICSISLSPPVGIAIELYARRSVYFSCAPLIRQRGESGGEKKLKAPERPIVCGAGGKKSPQFRTTPLQTTRSKAADQNPGGQGGAE